MNNNRDSRGRYTTEDKTCWKDLHIDFWNEYVPFYEKHTRVETCNKFGITEAQHKTMCKAYNYIKDWNKIHPAYDKDKHKCFFEPLSTRTFTFEEFTQYYEQHTREETLVHFNLSLSMLKTYCKLHNYTKPKNLVGKQITKRAKDFGKMHEFELFISSLDFWMEYVPYFETHTREETIKHFNINVGDHKQLLKIYDYKKPKDLVLKTACKQYNYNNILFDSIPEIAVYIYYTDHNIPIQYQPGIYFEYNFDNTTHKYFPDFIIDGKIIEIKGNHFFKEDGTMCNPFDHSQDAKYEAKHQCGLANGVVFWRNNEYKFAIDYCIITYGENWFTVKNIIRKKV